MLAEATSTCTQVCGNQIGGRSCSKICLVGVYPEGQPEKRIKAYAIIDDQSNRSLAKSAFFDIFNISVEKMTPYTLKTCTGVSEAVGRRISNFIVDHLPTLIECNALPDNRLEIPTPDAAHAHAHLLPVATKIPPLDTDADILLLLGRDIIQAHKVKEQINGPVNAPFAQRLELGWVIVGDVCLGGAHKPTAVSTFRSHALENGCQSLFSHCLNSFQMKERCDGKQRSIHGQAARTNMVGKSVFDRSHHFMRS